MKKNSTFLILAISVLLACALVLLGRQGADGAGVLSVGGNMSVFQKKAAFVIVECPAQIKDRVVQEQFLENGIEGIISESTQFFLLDEWRGTAQIPLDTLDERLIPEDPRRDGYAEKLRAFFVNESRRRFFVPLSNWKNQNTQAVRASIQNALRNIPQVSISIRDSVRPASAAPFAQIMLFAAKSCALAALFFLCALFLPNLAREIVSRIFYKKMNRPVRSNASFENAALCVAFLAPLLVYALFGIAAAFPPALIAAPPFLAALFLFAPPLIKHIDAARREHILFSPAKRRRSGLKGKIPTTLLLPPAILLTLSAIFYMSLFFAGAQTENVQVTQNSVEAGDFNKGYAALVTEDDYASHARFQASFSYKPLGRDGEAEYLHYREDESGLYEPAGSAAPDFDAIIAELPPYPFTALLHLLGGADS